MASVSLLPFFLLTLINFAGGLVFHLPSGRVKCITEDLRAGAMSVARYAIAADDPSPEIHNVSARVSDPQGEILHRAENVGSGEFSFAAAAAGEYTACFWSPHFQLSASVSIDFDWKIGVAAKNLAVIAKKGKVDVMETQLKKLEGSINSIHEEMIFLREREEAAWRLNESTNSQMGLLGILSLIICLAVAGLQLLHLKSFFKREKIL